MAVMGTKSKKIATFSAFFPFLFGVYPYTSATEKQIKAMEIAGVERREYTIAEIVRALVEKLTQNFRT